MKSFYPKPGDITKKWYLVDLNGRTLGRAATQIARVLMGKHKPEYTPSVDTGDFVVAINSDTVKLTGKKWTEKVYHRHTGFVGGIRSITAEKQRQKDSTQLIYIAVKGMLPKNTLGRQMMKKLKVYPKAEHKNQAQQPQPLEV